MPAKLLEGKVAILTGAARGQGAAEARKFVAEGAKVVLGDVLDDAGAAVAAELGKDAIYTRLDISQQTDWEKAVKEAEALGSLDILVNNAAIYWRKAIVEEDIDEVKRLLDINLLGAFRGIQAVAEPMAKSGGGSIVNISSVGGLTGVAYHSAYAMSKWGLRGLSRTAAIELGPMGIRVNSIHPGPIDTDMLLEVARNTPNYFAGMPLGRAGRPEEVADLVVYLASDYSSYQTGGEYLIDGGGQAGIMGRGAGADSAE